jgi:hypothetical protein
MVGSAFPQNATLQNLEKTIMWHHNGKQQNVAKFVLSPIYCDEMPESQNRGVIS